MFLCFYVDQKREFENPPRTFSVPIFFVSLGGDQGIVKVEPLLDYIALNIKSFRNSRVHFVGISASEQLLNIVQDIKELGRKENSSVSIHWTNIDKQLWEVSEEEKKQARLEAEIRSYCSTTKLGTRSWDSVACIIQPMDNINGGVVIVADASSEGLFATLVALDVQQPKKGHTQTIQDAIELNSKTPDRKRLSMNAWLFWQAQERLLPAGNSDHYHRMKRAMYQAYLDEYSGKLPFYTHFQNMSESY